MDVQNTVTTGTVSDQLNVLSMNTSGWNTFIGNYLNTILLSYSVNIFAIQEHWLLDQNLYKLENTFHEFDVFALPARKANSKISKGRPSGGIAFFVKNNLCSSVKRLSCPNSSRVQGLHLCLNEKSYVIINCYFPVDTQSANMDITELLQCLQDVQYIMDLCEDDPVFIMTGDLNADFNRNTIFVQLVKTFLLNNNLDTLWNKFGCDYTYSFSKTVNGLNRTYFSVIDHFCVSSNFVTNCLEAAPLHSPDNLSNHVPIILKLKCNLSNLITDHPDRETTIPSKPVWGRASDVDLSMYECHLDNLLRNIEVPNSILYCTDVHCDNPQHKIDIDLYSIKIMDSISTAVDSNIPCNNPGIPRRTPVPGWNQYVKPFRDDSLFWHSVWVSAGRPQNTVLHQIMRSTRAKYHFAIKKIRRLESEIRKDNMLQDSLNGKINDILKHIKSTRKTNKGPVNNIDGIMGSDNISSHFSDIYKEIYNRHRSTDNVNKVFSNINNSIDQTAITELDKITDELIINIINNLDFGKSDEFYNWGTDALKFGVNCIAPQFKCLFRAFLVHGHISHPFLCCALLPIVKNAKNSKFSSDNYRLIAISSLILKILDHIVLTLSSDNFIFTNLQFGFQRNCSASMTTWLMLETVNYFTNRGSPVYLCLLDLKKAFDTVKYDLLFEKLKNRVHPLFLRLVMYSYLHQSVYVRWNGRNSEPFSIMNGVRQGAVASPIFFNAYIDELFDILKTSGFGCEINNFYYGLIGFADDCALIAPSREALQNILSICESYFTKHGIDISVSDILAKSKTKCIAFNINIDPRNIMLYNKPLPWVESHIHLGHTVHKDETMSHDVFCKRAEFISKVHAIRQELGSQDPSVLVKLVRIYYCSFYGSNLWDLFSDTTNKLFITWNNAIRNFYDLPFPTHRFILQDLVDIPHLRTCLLRRFTKFYSTLRNCSKVEVRNLFHLQKHDVRSSFGRNCHYLCREFDATSVDSIAREHITMPIKTPENELWRVPFLKELLQVRDGHADIDMTPGDINNFIDHVCCS